MKKFLSIIAISLITFGVSAQITAPTKQMTRHTVCKGCSGTQADTATNTGTAYDTIVLNLPYRNASIEVQCTKISGTLGGILKVQVANVNTLTTGPSWKTLTDTATVSNTTGTKSYYFELPGAAQLNNTGTLKNNVPSTLPYCIYRILWTGTGTMSGSMKAWFVGRQ